MDTLGATLGTPWEQWAALAATAWVFALMCFIVAFGRTSARSRSWHRTDAGKPATVGRKPEAGAASNRPAA